MTQVYRLFGSECIKLNLGYYLVHQVVSREAALKVANEIKSLVKAVASNVEGLLLSLNVPLEKLYVPIAQDYEKYYSAPNYGEIIGARL